MRDPVALAYSGRIPEARQAALEQAASDDPFLVAQGLEALAVLGQQHGVTGDARVDELLVRRAKEGPSLARKAFEAGWSLGSRALEPLAAERLAAGEGGWEVLRYAGELPSLTLARALAQGWPRLSERLRDEALLTSCVMPVATKAENDAWGQRALALAREGSEDVRLAALRALAVWRPPEAVEVGSRALEDQAAPIRTQAIQLLLQVDPMRLADRAEELGDEFPDVRQAVPLPLAAQAKRRREER